MTKSRLSLVKPITLPSLEFMAALIGGRLAHTVQQVDYLRNRPVILLKWFNGDIDLEKQKVIGILL